MAPRRLSLLLPVLAVALLTQGCKDTPDLMSPVEPQFAKGGKTEQPGGPAPNLEEFWVYSEDGVDYVHMVVSGDADAIKKTVVYDHFFNGWRDDDPPVDQHYEFFFSGGPSPQAESIDGVIHVDLPFRGERRVIDGVAYPYPDFYVTSVGGSGADPFTFTVGAYKNDNRVESWVPLGVIFNGETKGSEATDLLGVGHASAHSTVRSYATWQGLAPKGDIWVKSLSLDGNIQCQMRTVSDGRGKNRESRTAAVVTGTITVEFGRDPAIDVVPEHPEWEYVWWEGHFYDENTGALSARAVPPSQDGGTWSFSREMPEGWKGGLVAFAIDYLYPSASPQDPFGDFAYNPERNVPLTIAGHGGGEWVNDASQVVGDGKYPLALSTSLPVNCK